MILFMTMPASSMYLQRLIMRNSVPRLTGRSALFGCATTSLGYGIVTGSVQKTFATPSQAQFSMHDNPSHIAN